MSAAASSKNKMFTRAPKSNTLAVVAGVGIACIIAGQGARVCV